MSITIGRFLFTACAVSAAALEAGTTVPAGANAPETPRRVAYAVRDQLETPPLGATRIKGKIGEKADRLIENRCRSDFARHVVVREAREAFAHPDDDIFNAPVGMWKGEFWGKLMISSSRVAEYVDDPSFTKFLSEEAHRLMAFQRPDGYLGTYVNPEFVSPGDPRKAQKVTGCSSDWCWNLWCRKYTLWGLLSIYRVTGERDILEAARRAMRQQIEMLRAKGILLCDTGTTAMAGMPSCSILKPLVLLYRETGDALFLDYAREIVSYWDRPGNPKPNFFPNAASGRSLAEWYPDMIGRWGKAYEMMSCLDGVLEYYRLTGEARCLEMVRRMQEIIWTYDRNLVECVGYNDQFVGAARHLNGTSEPCDAIHWIRLNLDLYLITGEKKYVDVIERTYLNAYLAGVFRDGKWGAREVRSHGRHIARFGQSNMRYQHCCVNNMPRTFMDIASLGVTREHDGTLRVNLYSPYAVDFGDADVSLSGEFPFEDRVTARIALKKATRVKFRLPDWSKATRVRRGVDEDFADAPAGDWYVFDAPAGTSLVTLMFDMTPRLECSTREATPERPKDHRFYRWSTGPRAVEIFRHTPAARLYRGPILLAKSAALGNDERDILRADMNGGGWQVSLRPLDSTRVMAAWEATFRKGTETYRTRVCDFASAGDAVMDDDQIAFSIFF